MKYVSFKIIVSISILVIGSGSSVPDFSREPAPREFERIFDGKTFNNWEGDTSFWSIRDGIITGTVTPEHQLKQNSFLIYRGSEPGDFELKLEYRISEQGNSGIQYRSEEVDSIPFALKGYQADIDGKNTYTGQNYEERGRGFLAKRGEIAELHPNQPPKILGSLGPPDSLKKLIKMNQWNQVHLVVRGNTMKHFINGKLMSEARDLDNTNRKLKGLIGLQLHVAREMSVEFRNIMLKAE